MTGEEFTKLKTKCGELVKANYTTLRSLNAKSFVYAFWQGVMAAQGEHPYVIMCLASGRYSELVIMEK